MKPFTAVLTLMIIFVGCSEMPGSSYDDELSGTELGTEQSTILNSNAPFPVFHQVFNHNTEPWATETEGEEELGWCGSIELVDRRSGEVNPAVGRNYATIQHGACNDFWNGVFPGLTSAPATSKKPDLYSTEWPVNGFTQQLDIYLDPVYGTGNEGATLNDTENVVFSYSNAVRVLGVIPPERYFEVSVTKDGETGPLSVGDYEIEEKGWYTFRHLFDSDSEGRLTVEFQLVRNGRTLYTEAIDQSLFGIPTSSLEVDDLGSAHIWFVSIADGLELPIDQHRLRRGK